VIWRRTRLSSPQESGRLVQDRGEVKEQKIPISVGGGIVMLVTGENKSRESAKAGGKAAPSAKNYKGWSIIVEYVLL